MDLSPKAQPVAYTTVAALIVATLADYGFHITGNLSQLLLILLPFVLAAVVNWFSVYAPKTVARIRQQEFHDGARYGSGDVVLD